MLALGDTLAFAVSENRSFGEEDFAKFHPGGTLGMKLSPVENHMRPLAECRIAKTGRTVQETLEESNIPGRRTGVILLVRDDFTLAGIFTDSDFTKLIAQKGGAALSMIIDDVMIRTPKNVHIGDKMAQAIELLEATKISQLPVLDTEEHPVGILDKTDLRIG